MSSRALVPANAQDSKAIAVRGTSRVDPPLKWHGGKYYLARDILALAPPHIHYVEPFAGGLQVLLAKDPEGVSEVVNDVHGGLTNFWRVLQCDEAFPVFQRRLEAMPFAESEYERAWVTYQAMEKPGDAPDVENAVNFFVACRQSLAGRMRGFTGVTKTRTRRGMNNEVSAWIATVDKLPEVHARLRRVLILNRDAINVIKNHDSPKAWLYLDPPYLDETRATPDVYAHEMSRDAHVELLETLGNVKAKFALSGYRSALYDEAADRFGWQRHDFEIPNQAAAGATKRVMTECVWVNYEASEAIAR